MSKVFIDTTRKSEIDKTRDIEALDAWFQEQLEYGYEVPDRNFKLGLKQSDVSQLLNMFILAKEATNLGAPIPAIVDTEGFTHDVSLNEFTMIVLGHGQHYAALSNEYARRKKTILDS